MGDFKLKLSDVIRYIVLGAVEAMLCYLIIDASALRELKKQLPALTNDPIVTLIIALSSFYLAGYITQMILQLFCKGNLMGTGLGETGLFIHRFPTSLLNRNKNPHWIYYSKHPDKVLGIYREILETETESDVKTEFLYANNLFQGVALALVVFSFFALEKTFNPWLILLSAATVTFLCLMGYLSVKYNFALIANKLLMLVVPLAIVCIYACNHHAVSGFMIGGGILLCLCIAGQLSRRQIRRIDILIKYGNKGENENRFISTLKRNGVPTTFILTRLSDSCLDYYEEQLASIANQTYPNIKVIVLIDRKSTHHKEFVDIIEQYRKTGLNISHYISEGTGPASLAYEIRDIFLNYADSDDVAINLDADDLLATRNTVSIIIGRMARTKANICLLTFEVFGDTRLNYAKNYPNEIVRNIAEKSTERGKAIKASELIRDGNAHLISSIGWTKCYRKDVIRSYQRLWDSYKDDLDTYSKYEDFPDIVALLSKKSRICAVGRTSILFRKHEGSITTSVTPDNYRVHITHYLQTTLQMCRNNDSLSTAAKLVIRKLFIPYKFVQYLNIVKIKTTKPEPGFEDYSAKEFYSHFADEVYRDTVAEQSCFKEGILEILRQNHELGQDDHIGYYGKDLPSNLNKANPTFLEVIQEFGL